MPTSSAHPQGPGAWSTLSASRDRVRADFATVASHQLRTPISIIRWALDSVLSGRSGRLTIKQREYLERAYQQNSFMARIVGDLLRISRIEEGGVSVVFSAFSVPALVRAVLQESSLLAKAYNCTLTVRAKDGVPPVTSDQIKLKEVLQVLVDNAIRYGKREGRVDIIIAAAKGNILISVRDHGIGIPTRQQKNIFTKFFRAENAIRSQTEGLGLELYIARSYVTAMGGNIVFNSVPGEGTTFMVALPRKPIPGRLPAVPVPARRAADELSRMVQHLGDGVLILDMAFRVLHCNSAAAKLFNLNREAIGSYVGDLVDAPELIKFLKRRPTGEDSMEAKLRLPGDDHLAPFRLLLLPLRNQDVITGWALVVQETIDHHRADLAAAERIRREREFVSITVHELNGPLSVNRWSLEMLKRESIGKLNAEQRRLVDQIYRNNERQLVLVKDMLNLAKLQQGRFSINPQPTNLAVTLRDVLDSFRTAAHIKHIAVRWAGVRRLPSVPADAGRIAQVFTNLISNAIKYTPPHGRVTVRARTVSGTQLRQLTGKLGVAVRHTESPQYLVFSVQDSGIGIPSNQRRKLFTMFFRSQEVLKRKIEGTGLGLYIARAIVELHRGDIWFESQPSRGSVFSFSVPVAAPR
ncbi:MAG: ATP-binding protein [bacterium]|nr:ATP-binding protein [bacterium]